MNKLLVASLILFLSLLPAFAQQTGIITANKTRVRTKPMIINSGTVGYANKGDTVTILDRTKVTDTVFNMEDYWYKVKLSNGKRGWVFGRFIQPSQQAPNDKPRVLNTKTDFQLSQQKAGLFEVGISTGQLFEKYDRKLTKLTDLKIEGKYSPAIAVFLSDEGFNKPALFAEIDNGKIFRFHVYNARFKTNDGIGVDSTLGDIRKSYNIDAIGYAEGKIYALVDSLEMSFEINYADIPKKCIEAEDYTLVPDSAAIVSVLVWAR